jgi:hypothetical protein
VAYSAARRTRNFDPERILSADIALDAKEDNFHSLNVQAMR